MYFQYKIFHKIKRSYQIPFWLCSNTGIKVLNNNEHAVLDVQFSKFYIEIFSMNPTPNTTNQ